MKGALALRTALRRWWITSMTLQKSTPVSNAAPEQISADQLTTKVELPLPGGESRVVACSGGRGELDDAAASHARSGA